jgi:hypothetical protein
MLRKALLRTAIATLLVASATQAQTLDQTLSGCNGAAPLRTIQANPSNYRSLITGLIPGDRLQLAAGTYTQGLNLWNKNGQPDKCIVIEGPASGSPALFTGSDSWNLVSLKDSSYIALRNLSLDGLGKDGDGIKAIGRSRARAPRTSTRSTGTSSTKTPTNRSSRGKATSPSMTTCW